MPSMPCAASSKGATSMTERELGKALVDLDRAPPARNPRELTEKILKRDRLTLRLLTGIAILFWTAATVGLVWLVSNYLLIVSPRLRAYAAGRAQLQNDWNDWAYAVDIAAGSALACLV